MSIKYMTAVWSNSKQSGTRLLILLAIADHANDEGIAWPGMKSLAKKARLKSRVSVLRAIQEICRDGELEIIESGGISGKTNRYQIPCSLLDTRSSTATGGVALQLQGGVAVELHKSSYKRQESSEQSLRLSSTREIQNAYESCVPYKIDWIRGEGHAAKWLSDNGYTPDDIKRCYADLKAGWWADKTLSLTSLKKQIGEWKHAKRNGSTEKILEFTA